MPLILLAAGLIALMISAMAAVGHWDGGPKSARVLPPPRSSKGTAFHGSVTPTAPPKAAGSSVDLSGATSSGGDLPSPTGLAIPAIGLETTTVPLGRDPDGSAAVPSGTTYAGWYDLGPKPGAIGPAVIIGHVDSYTGPGVFFNLKVLLPGDSITVDDGNVPVTFVVQRVVTYAKDQFPTSAVFGPTPDAELRLITCGGPFDRSIGHYEDNVVVFATATSVPSLSS
jgi:hypothetical protein